MKRIISIIIAAMLLVSSAQAAEWITLSSWSYQEVSEFVAADLMPECLKGTKNYKDTINRGQFYELIYSVLRKTKMITQERTTGYYTDCEAYPAVNMLDSVIYEKRYDNKDEEKLLYPEKAVTREWAAEVVFYVLRGGIYEWTDEATAVSIAEAKTKIKDFDEIVNGEKISWLINDGIMSDVGDGYFMPKNEMSVEQAVTVAARMYKRIPRVIKSDNEQGNVVRTINAGVRQEITDTLYNIKKDGKLLLSLETDVYSNIFAAEYEGQLLIFAVNFNNKTDVFDAYTGEIIYTIPYIINEVDEEPGIVYTISGKYMPYYSGVWSMDNKEIYPPEYSRYEILMMQTGKTESYRMPDGVLYYADWNDNGNMYRIDTNGENKTLIVDGYDCTSINDINGKLFFNDNKQDYSLYYVNYDGSDLTAVSEKYARVETASRQALTPYELGERSSYAWQVENYGFYEMPIGIAWHYDGSDYDYDIYKDIYDDESFLYVETDKDVLSRYRGNYTERRNGEVLYRFTKDKKRVKLADFYVTNVISAHNGDGKIYFMDYEKIFKTGSSPIYVNDNNELKRVSGDYEAAAFGFFYDVEKNSMDYTRLAFITQDEMFDGTYHLLNLKTGKVTQKKLLSNPNDNDSVFDENGRHYFSYVGTPEELKLYHKEEFSDTYVEYNGNTMVIPRGNIEAVVGECIYYTDWKSIYFANPLRDRESHTLRCLNYKTGETADVAYDYAKFKYRGDDMFVYQTSLGEAKIIKEGGIPVTIYPCKGLYTYGELETVMHMPQILTQKHSYFKLAKDGNVTRITENDAQKGIYILNDGTVKYPWN